MTWLVVCGALTSWAENPWRDSTWFLETCHEKQDGGTVSWWGWREWRGCKCKRLYHIRRDPVWGNPCDWSSWWRIGGHVNYVNSVRGFWKYFERYLESALWAGLKAKDTPSWLCEPGRYLRCEKGRRVSFEIQPSIFLYGNKNMSRTLRNCHTGKKENLQKPFQQRRCNFEVEAQRPAGQRWVVTTEDTNKQGEEEPRGWCERWPHEVVTCSQV